MPDKPLTAPPARLVAVIERARAGLQRLHRSTVPGNIAMTASSGLADEAALAAYDFRRFRLVVDVGGGHGSVLSTVLRRAPDARGILFDLPAVVAGKERTRAEYANLLGRAGFRLTGVTRTVTPVSIVEAVPV